jgi:hypothetical protein
MSYRDNRPIMSRAPSPHSPDPLGAAPPKKNGVIIDANIHNFAPVARIMKTALPENAKIAKEAKECMQECVSEFISFITSEGMFSPTSRCILCAMLMPHHSIRKMPSGKTKNSQRRGHSLCHDILGL